MNLRVYEKEEDLKKKIVVGNITVWLILLVSLMVSIFSWYKLSGLAGATTNLSYFEQAMLWSIVAIGFLSELVKKVTLSTFRNKKIWIYATVVSIITVMGSFAILDQDRSRDLKKGSDSYRTAVKDTKEAKQELGKWAEVANTDMAMLLKMRDDNIARAGSNKARKKSKASLNSYYTVKKEIAEKIKKREKYDAAKGMYELAKKEVKESGGGGGDGEVTYPLFKQVKTITGITVAFLTTLFFLAVTLLLEVSAFYIGGEIDKIKQFMYLTKAELLDIENMSTFGVSMQAVKNGSFKRIVDAQRDLIEVDRTIINMRKNKVNEKGAKSPISSVAKNVRGMRVDQEESENKAKIDLSKPQAQSDPKKEPQAKASSSTSKYQGLDLEGHSSEALTQRKNDYEGKQCPACHEVLSGRRKFCSKEHGSLFWSYVRGPGNKLN